MAACGPVRRGARPLAAKRPLEIVLPAVASLADEIRPRIREWPVVPRIVVGEAEKLAAFRRARLALAASGTVALELALAGVPTVGAYKVGAIEMRILRALVTASFVLLPNLILGRMAVPELIQEDCNPQALAVALEPLFDDTPERRAQLDALEQVRAEIASRQHAARGQPRWWRRRVGSPYRSHSRPADGGVREPSEQAGSASAKVTGPGQRCGKRSKLAEASASCRSSLGRCAGGAISPCRRTRFAMCRRQCVCACRSSRTTAYAVGAGGASKPASIQRSNAVLEWRPAASIL